MFVTTPLPGRICLAWLLATFATTTFLNAISIEDYPTEFSPDPLRYASEVAALGMNDTPSSPPNHAIVCTGSSTMRGWHPRIENDLAGLTVIPRGFGGSVFSDVIYFADELILKYHPRAVLIYEGDNDIAIGKSPEAVLDDLKFLVDLCRETLPDLRFYVLGIKPSGARWSIWPTMVEANELMAQYCDITEGLVFVDVALPLLTDDNTPRSELFIGDQLHLNWDGYDVWTEAIAPVLIQHESPFEAVGEWSDLPIIRGHFVDTGSLLGWLAVEHAPWVFSFSMEKWIYIPEPPVSSSGVWAFIPKVLDFQIE